MDCRVQASVHSGFDRLFGVSGTFGHALTGMLVIYVAVIAYGLLTGRMGLTVRMVSPKIVTLALVMTFVTAWPAYSVVFYNLLVQGPDEIASALQNQNGSATVAFVDNLDSLIKRFSDIALVLDAGTSGRGDSALAILGPKPMPITLFWLSGMILILSTVGTLIVARLCLYILLAVGPIFILLALFPQTRGIFNGWLRTSMAMALVPMLIVLSGTSALSVIMPVLTDIAVDPMLAVQEVKPMVVLFIASVFYVALLIVLVWVAATIVGDWRVTFPGSEAYIEEQAPAPQPLELHPLPADAKSGLDHENARGKPASEDGKARIATIVQHLSQDQSRVYPASARSDGLSYTVTVRTEPVTGLGQRFRPFGAQPRLRKAGK